MPEVGFKRNAFDHSEAQCLRSEAERFVGCEGWHALLNRKAVSGQLPFYKLLLHAESKLLSVTAKTLSERC